MKAVISNASALPQHLKHKIVEYFGEGKLHETYGSTEAGFVTNLRPPFQLQKERCVGTPFPHTFVKLTDDNFCEVGPEEAGELWVKSPSAFAGRLPVSPRRSIPSPVPVSFSSPIVTTDPGSEVSVRQQPR